MNLPKNKQPNLTENNFGNPANTKQNSELDKRHDLLIDIVNMITTQYDTVIELRDDIMNRIDVYVQTSVQEADRLARIDELEKIEIGGDKIWTVDKKQDMAMLISERINQLKDSKDGNNA